MNKLFNIFIILCGLLFTASLYAQNHEDKQSVVNAVKMKELDIKRAALIKQIAIEDKNRNKQEYGVSPERMEIINTKQDSICLELRSKLVAIELEIKELSKK